MVKGLKLTSAKFVLFAIVSLLSFVLIYNTMQDAVDGELVEYDAIFSDVSGLRVGDNIRVAGVQVGKVQSIEVHGRQAKIHFALKQSQQLLDTTVLVMRYQNLLGQRYLALTQGPKLGNKVAVGSTIPVNRTDPGFDLTELLNGFRPLFEILKPEDVNQLARTVVQVLQGEGGTVSQLLAQTARLTNFIADRDQIFGEIVTNLTPVLRNLNGQGDAINTTVDELKRLMNGLAKERVTIGTSLEQISALITQTSDFLVDARAPSIRLLKSLRAATGMFVANLDAVKGAVQGFPKLISALGRITSYQNAGNVYICQLRLSVGGISVGTPDGPYSEVCKG